ncbi:non-ribosomal peptide synthetase [Catelliglobosispora koreensis]|uniref:non-ribosomal peptide synthetase n=1 Tax=Catelliglobosispora koreensis TaxID=129052 RepID=UPI000363EE08|nr:non-ribosomal peptide synthetase [Catelliglobosispora koreensis]
MKNIRFQACLVGRNGTSQTNIPKQPGRIVARAPLSDLQGAYLFGELGDYSLGGPALFYEEYACREVDIVALSRALHELMRRHEMLRATFDASATLRVHNELPVPLSYRSLQGFPAEVCAQILAESRDECYRLATPLTDAAPFTVKVFKMDSKTIVQVCGRLLAIDGFSGEIFAQELKALLAGQQLPPLRYTFREYRNEIDERRELPEYATARAYWMDRIETLPSAPQLPRRRRGGDPDPNLVRRIFRMPSQQWAKLAAATKKNRLTPTMAIGAAFCEVLRHWAKAPNFTINIMYGERAPLSPDVGNVVGNFSSTLLLECAGGAPESTFLDRAKAWRRQLASDLQNSAFSGVSVIRELNQRHGNSREPLMPVVFTSMLGVGEDSSGVFLEILGWQRLEGRVRTPQVSLDHQVYMADNELVVQWDTADDLYVPGVIDEMFAAYQRVLTRLADSEEAWHAEAFDFTPASQLAIRARVNDTSMPIAPVTLHELFERQAMRSPGRPAVITAAGQVTYGQLRSQANAVAHALRVRGVRPGELVGVTAARGPHQIAALLGVMMAGGAYVPVSPQWPEQRREQVSQMCELRFILSDVEEPAGEAEAEVLPVAQTIADNTGAPEVVPDHDGSRLAYVIFTSGTSGTPKGVMITHTSAANTIADINDRFTVGPQDRVLAVSDYTFDLSVWDVFGLLAAGGAIVVPDAQAAREVTHLYSLALDHDVTIWNSVPAYLAMFVDFVRAGERSPLPALRLAMVSGDWVPVTLGGDLLDAAPNARCVSLGGATEASIWSNYYPVPAEPPEDWVSIPYGFPLRNQRFHVLDGQLRHRPDWVAGELYIAGHGLAAGYHNSPELTEAAFKVHPRTGERIYRTGDWGRYWPDGTLEFLGREDPQVKVNGFRVELTEIEAVLLAHEAVNDAVVVTRKATHGVSLVGFAASDRTHPGFESELRSYLEDRLPSYMVPRIIDVRFSLPLTANGKVDRRLLSEQAIALNTVAITPKGAAPVGDTERALAKMWQELLDVPEVSRFDDFFASGGNSLHAAQLMNRIEQEFGQRLPLATLYTSASVEKLARSLVSQTPQATRRVLQRLGGSGGDPLVLVHPVGGDLLCYRDLVSAVESRRSVLGLAGSTATSIEEIAAEYLSEVVQTVNEGTVRLAGWSLGGVIAYEMGRQLLANGRDCTVLMIDPWVRRQDAPVPTELALAGSFLSNLAESEVDLSAAGLDGQAGASKALHYAWSDLSGQLPVLKQLTFDELSRMFEVFARNTKALLAYTPQVTAQLPVELIEAGAGLAGPGGHYLMPLRQALPDMSAGMVLPADHFGMLKGDNVSQIARLL